MLEFHQQAINCQLNLTSCQNGRLGIVTGIEGEGGTKHRQETIARKFIHHAAMAIDDLNKDLYA